MINSSWFQKDCYELVNITPLDTGFKFTEFLYYGVIRIRLSKWSF